jgi:hypothetical protein
LMMKRYGDKALEENSTRVDELTAAGDHEGADTCAGSQRPSSSSRQHTCRTAALIGTQETVARARAGY